MRSGEAIGRPADGGIDRDEPPQHRHESELEVGRIVSPRYARIDFDIATRQDDVAIGDANIGLREPGSHGPRHLDIEVLPLGPQAR